MSQCSDNSPPSEYDRVEEVECICVYQARPNACVLIERDCPECPDLTSEGYELICWTVDDCPAQSPFVCQTELPTTKYCYYRKIKPKGKLSGMVYTKNLLRMFRKAFVEGVV